MGSKCPSSPDTRGFLLFDFFFGAARGVLPKGPAIPLPTPKGFMFMMLAPEPPPIPPNIFDPIPGSVIPALEGIRALFPLGARAFSAATSRDLSINPVTMRDPFTLSIAPRILSSVDGLVGPIGFSYCSVGSGFGKVFFTEGAFFQCSAIVSLLEGRHCPDAEGGDCTDTHCTDCHVANSPYHPIRIERGESPCAGSCSAFLASHDTLLTA